MYDNDADIDVWGFSDKWVFLFWSKILVRVIQYFLFFFFTEIKGFTCENNKLVLTNQVDFLITDCKIM